MKILIVEDDFISRKLMIKYLTPYGEVDIAVDGEEALEALSRAWEDNAPYQLICLDIKMPGMDGHEVLDKIRKIEKEKNIGEKKAVKVIMTTILKDPENVFNAYYKGRAVAYLVKPFGEDDIIDEIKKLGLV
ncbi:MAG: response regulator [Spirochaetales bacterium]|nr:response regulator [Spirochaetales bacterium]